tara:strand:- start:315 stop:575 length:261 start_codon:yes stop_codon:yes gene_type:complete
LKYKPEVWKLKGVIEKQKGIQEAQKEAHYVLGERTIEGSNEPPKKQPPKKDDNVNKRLKILETKIKRLTKRIDKIEGKPTPRPPCR